MKKIILAALLLFSFNCFALSIGKGETKEFTANGLYEPFKYQMNCSVRTPDFRSIINGNGGSQYMIIATINGITSSQQIKWDCHDTYHCRADGSLPGFIIPGVTNGSLFKFINRPDYAIEINCTFI